MALSLILGEAELTAEHMETTAEVTDRLAPLPRQPLGLRGGSEAGAQLSQ